MREANGTTLNESWLDKSQSHNHPMFGAIVSYFFTELLGIKQISANHFLIKPNFVEGLDEVKGQRQTELGLISIAYRKIEDNIEFNINFDQRLEVEFEIYSEKELLINPENQFLKSKR